MILLGLGAPTKAFHVAKQSRRGYHQARKTISYLYNDFEDAAFFDDSAENVALLPLSEKDKERMDAMRNRKLQIPLLILDSMLPGQCLRFASSDSKFKELIRYALQDDTPNEIGVIGLNPYTGRPLNMGVTITITKDCVSNHLVGQIATTMKGERRFEIDGAPFLEPELKSFYLANVDIIEGREEFLTDQQEDKADKLSSDISALVGKWLELVVSTGKSDEGGMERILNDIGKMPTDIGKRAIWVASLINPIPALGVCLEIRPAMLACKNKYEQINLAVISIQSSIDHLSGEKKLF